MDEVRRPESGRSLGSRMSNIDWRLAGYHDLTMDAHTDDEPKIIGRWYAMLQEDAADNQSRNRARGAERLVFAIPLNRPESISRADGEIATRTKPFRC